MTGPISGFSIGLPLGWHPVPSGEVPPEWAEVTAAAVVAGAAVPEGTVDALARQLLEVKASVDATRVRGAHSAVLVEHPEAPTIQAMMTMVLGRQLGLEAYEEQLEHVVENVDTAQVMGKQAIEATVPAGDVRGAHFLIGHLPAQEDPAGVHLEERVHLGVFPHECPDMIDVTAIAAGIGIFEDLPAVVVGLLEDLEVTRGVAA
ncbi:hypothetical protein [Promicromonospora iranensis]|uniref:Uncharacterized protein n=1 Tax=Promicromonospora iranensis TaxID=1105144 RepID=A0ABU2CMT9_9MICO|nr:hypothetical protein [Promicromonospora iranensis]MDR7382650.1 hypothetical protein [Promicromonospora iranensis]